MKEEPNIGFSKPPTSNKRQKHINNGEGRRATIKQMAELDQKFRATGVIQNEIAGEKNMLNQIELAKASFGAKSTTPTKSKERSNSKKFNDQTKKDVKLTINQSQ